MIISDVRKIERISLDHTEDIASELRGEVLAKAYDAFGYKADSFGTRGPLSKALYDLDIKPLDGQQVEVYKKSKERKRSVNWNIIASATGIAIICAFWVICTHIYNQIPDWILILGVVVTISLAMHSLFCTTEGPWPTYKSVQHWEKYSLGREGKYHEYDRYVPVHVLNWAVQIKDCLPKTSFVIHELTVTSGTSWPKPDPFLEVSYGSEKYYIAVWDEREFEAKL
jgi:hypothetical protein